MGLTLEVQTAIIGKNSQAMFQDPYVEQTSCITLNTSHITQFINLTFKVLRSCWILTETFPCRDTNWHQNSKQPIRQQTCPFIATS